MDKPVSTAGAHCEGSPSIETFVFSISKVLKMVVRFMDIMRDMLSLNYSYTILIRPLQP